MLIIEPRKSNLEDTIYFSTFKNDFIARMNILSDRIVIEHNVPCCGSFVFEKCPNKDAMKTAIKTIEHILELTDN